MLLLVALLTPHCHTWKCKQTLQRLLVLGVCCCCPSTLCQGWVGVAVDGVVKVNTHLLAAAVGGHSKQQVVGQEEAADRLQAQARGCPRLGTAHTAAPH